MKQLICPHCLQPVIPEDATIENVTLDEVIDVILDFYNLDLEQLNLPNRKQPFPFIRQMICYTARKYAGVTLNAIAWKLNRDHTSVIHSISVFKNLLDVDEKVQAQFANIELLLKLLPETKRTYKNAEFENCLA